MEKLYYCNKPCTLVKSLDETDESIIQVLSYVDHIDSGSYDEPPYSEPEFNTIIVSNKYITKERVKLEDEWDLKFNKLEKDFREKNTRLHDEHSNIKKNLKTIEDKAKKYEGFDIMLDVLSGDISEDDIWALTCDYYHLELNKLSDVKTKADSYDREEKKQAIIFVRDFGRNRREDKYYFATNRYTDGSGCNTKTRLFRSEKEAIQGLLDHMHKHKRWYDYINLCDKYSFDIPEVKQAKVKKLADIENNRTKEKKRLLEKLERIK